MREGITVAGSIVLDKIKLITAYPEKGMLTNITTIQEGGGGCVHNTAVALKRFRPSFPVSVCGRVGEDAEGSALLRLLRECGADVSRMSVSKTLPTSFTDVMTVEERGERTFFHARGANAEFAPEHIDANGLNCKIFHIGYLLLLDAFDAPDEKFGTRMARFLAGLQKRGIRTSIDAVSEEGGRFAQVVVPALKYCDYAVVNEIEAGRAAGIAARSPDGRLLPENIRNILQRFLEFGVSRTAVVHCPEGGFALERDGGFSAVPSLSLPKGYIKGTVGAGDTFCAGVLFGLHEGMTAQECLRFASCAAACNLSAEDSSSGLRGEAETWKLESVYGRSEI